LLFIDPALATRVYFQPSGSRTNTDTPKNLFHATPENKALLEALYKCDFESPKLKGSDLTRKLLSEGKHVLCYVSDESDSGANVTIVVMKKVSNGMFFDLDETDWTYAVPCNDYANLVDGVLEVKK
jgi:exosome complex RNA-binding protein Csl4